MNAYYNEHDAFAAAWLRELIADGLIAQGFVDERDIQEVRPADLAGYDRCHFFAGIGGWDLALQLAGWPADRSVWTGSCPCQPFSSAARGRQSRRADDLHLWPHWRRLIAECAPLTVFGEQVPQAGDWFDGVCSDMDGLDYSVGAAVLPAVAFGFDHARPRLYFACHANSDGQSSVSVNAEAPRLPRHRSVAAGVVKTNGIPGRVGLLRGAGNSIVPQVAAEFIKAWMTA